MTITLIGVPKSTNNIYKHACRGSHPCTYMTADDRSLKENYQWQAKSQFHGNPLCGRLQIDVTLYFDGKGRKDWDNFHKLSMDALSGIVWEGRRTDRRCSRSQEIRQREPQDCD